MSHVNNFYLQLFEALRAVLLGICARGGRQRVHHRVGVGSSASSPHKGSSTTQSFKRGALWRGIAHAGREVLRLEAEAGMAPVDCSVFPRHVVKEVAGVELHPRGGGFHAQGTARRRVGDDLKEDRKQFKAGSELIYAMKYPCTTIIGAWQRIVVRYRPVNLLQSFTPFLFLSLSPSIYPAISRRATISSLMSLPLPA